MICITNEKIGFDKCNTGPKSVNSIKHRSNHSQVFREIAVLKIFVKFPGKHIGWSPFVVMFRVQQNNVFLKTS